MKLIVNIRKDADKVRVEELKHTLKGMQLGYVPQHFYNLLFKDIIESVETEPDSDSWIPEKEDARGYLEGNHIHY